MKRFLSAVLALSLLLGNLPAAVWAETVEITEETVMETSGETAGFHNGLFCDFLGFCPHSCRQIAKEQRQGQQCT